VVCLFFIVKTGPSSSLIPGQGRVSSREAEITLQVASHSGNSNPAELVSCQLTRY